MDIKNVCIGLLVTVIIIGYFAFTAEIVHLEKECKNAQDATALCKSNIDIQNQNILQLKTEEEAKAKKLSAVEKKLKLSSMTAQKESFAIMADDQPMTCEEAAQYAAIEAQKMGVD